MSKGELLAGLPFEVQVHIFGLALGPPIAGALLQDWLNVALVSQHLLVTVGPPVCRVAKQHPVMMQLTWLNTVVLRRLVLLSFNWMLTCLHAQVCKGWMRELVLHMPVLVGGDVSAFPVSFSFHDVPMPQLLPPTRQWLLQPVPHGLRIAELALCGQRRAACPSLAILQDLVLLPPSQLRSIQRLVCETLSAQTLLPCPG